MQNIKYTANKQLIQKKVRNKEQRQRVKEAQRKQNSTGGHLNPITCNFVKCEGMKQSNQKTELVRMHQKARTKYVASVIQGMYFNYIKTCKH